MRTVTPLDLRRELGRILDEASAGERFLVERDRKPLAMIVSVEDGRRLDEDREERRRRAEAALSRLEERARHLQDRYPTELSAVETVRLDRARDDV